MQIKAFTMVILRLYALYLLLAAFSAILHTPVHLRYPSGSGGLILINAGVTIGFSAIASFVLLKFTDQVAGWIVKDVNIDATTEISSKSLFRLSLGIAGAVFIVWGVEALVFNFSHLYIISQSAYGHILSSDVGLEQKARIIESVATILAGLVLFLGKDRLVQLATGIRKFGQPSLDDNGEEGRDA